MKNFDNNKKFYIIFDVVLILAGATIMVLSLVLTALGWNVDFTVGDKIIGVFCACIGLSLTIMLSMCLGITLTETEEKEKNNCFNDNNDDNDNDNYYLTDEEFDELVMNFLKEENVIIKLNDDEEED